MPLTLGGRFVRYHAILVASALLFLPLSTTLAQQTLNIQVSDPSERPVKNLQITTKGRGTTETTDNAGKATITFYAGAGVVELQIVSPADVDFLSPWQRSVTVPPEDWSIVVTTRGNRDLLEHPKAVAALAARTNHLQARKSLEDPAPSPESRRKAIETVAEEVGLEPTDIAVKIGALTAPQNDSYVRAMGFLDQRDWGQASEIFSQILTGSTESHSSESIEKATNSAFFLGEALFEQGLYSKSATAYERASKYRPNDPVILNNEGLSLTKAGDFKGASDVYQRAIQIMEKMATVKSLNYSTTTNNLAALRAYQGDSRGARILFQESLDLRRQLLAPGDFRLAISLNNVAAMQIAEGDCDSARKNLDEALSIEKQERDVSSGGDREAYSKAIASIGSLNANAVTAAGSQQAATREVSVAGNALVSSTPGPSTILTNLAMVDVCKGDLADARQILLTLEAEQANPLVVSDLGNTLLNLAWVEEAAGNWVRAAAYYQQAIERYRTALGPLHPQVALALTFYGEMLVKSGDKKKATETLKEAIPIVIKAFGDGSESVRRLTERVVSLERQQ